MVVDPGLVLAGVSLAFQIFSGCVVAFDLLSTALRFGEDAARHLAYLSLQEFLLFAFAKQAGIIEQRREPYLDYDRVQKSLAQIESLLTDIEHLKKRYGFKAGIKDKEHDPAQKSDKKSSKKSILPVNNSVDPQLEFLYHANLLEERKRILTSGKQLNRAANFPKKIWWSAVDQARFKEFITDLSKWIDSLNEFLDSNRQRIQHDYLSKTYAKTLSNTDQLERLENLFFAMFATQNSALPVAMSKLKAIHLAQLSQHVSDGDKVLRSMAILDSSDDDATNFDDYNISIDRITNLSDQIGLYHNSRVLMDLKDLRTEDGGTVTITFNRQIRDLIRLLGVPKPAEFCTLSLRGYLNDLPRKWGYVFDVPIQSQIQWKCESLYDLLHNDDYLPSLTHRVRLAEKLASALYLFHSVDWFHKAISSHTIIFFTTIDEKDCLANPYFIGFDYSRLATKVDESEKPRSNPLQDIYRHIKAQYPTSLDEPFRAIYDIYSLGVVFLELAYWQPVESVLVEENVLNFNQCTSDDLKKVPGALLRLSTCSEPLYNTSFRVGDVFSDIIRTCLTGGFEGANKMYCEGLQDSFFEKVVTPLKKLAV